MKSSFGYLLCIILSLCIGWYAGFTRPVIKNQRALLEYNQYVKDHLPDFKSDMIEFNKQREEASRQEAPYAASTASIALAALKSLDANDQDDARARMAAIVGNYYRGHSVDGDTNLLDRIVASAATNTVLSNSIHRK